MVTRKPRIKHRNYGLSDICNPIIEYIRYSISSSFPSSTNSTLDRDFKIEEYAQLVFHMQSHSVQSSL